MSSPTTTDLLRTLPQVDRVLADPAMAEILSRHSREAATRAIRVVLDRLREDLREGRRDHVPESAILAAGVAEELGRGRGTRRMINATGVVAHTGLGRAVLPDDALRAIQEEARGYCLLAVDPETTGRATRYRHCEEILRELTGAEAACVVNNNAAATMLVLNTLADGKEVVISRGQLVEIGGAFRIPDVLRRSGAVLREVGTTNKTHLRDYEEAITADTGLIMRVHTSNYRMVGFVKEVPIAELTDLGRRRGIPVVDDLGAGALVDLKPFGYPEEPLVRDSVRAGADVVTMSSDKLIGGPQGGILVGRAELIERIHKNPLYRTMRVGKLTLIALEATLRYFLDSGRALKEHPVTRMLTLSAGEIETRARELAAAIGTLPGVEVEVVPETSEVGSGSYPAHPIPTFVVTVRREGAKIEDLARRLRTRPVSIFARVKNDRLMFDPRTLQEGEGAELAAGIREILESQDQRRRP